AAANTNPGPGRPAQRGGGGGFRAGGHGAGGPARPRPAAACNLLAARRTQQSRRARPARGG
ncbi:RNA helicase, partial [Pseudomonas aeruginosa]